MTAPVAVGEGRTLTGKPVITVDWVDEDGMPRLAMYPPERWRSANRLIRRVVRRLGAES